jgi:hypothetical protein
MNAVMTDSLRDDSSYKIMENIIADGDLSKLTPKQRVEYYYHICKKTGLEPLTRPFEYQRFNGKVVLYARKEASEQLRFLHKVSIYKMEKELFNDVFVVTAYARTADGKEDVATGAVATANLKGDALSNACMKAETKAKRRVTLSICGLGFTDQSEIDSIPGSTPVAVNHETGEIIDAKALPTLPGQELARAKLVENVMYAANIDQLQDAYKHAWVAHGGNVELMQDITDIKDRRKADLETKYIEGKV